MKYLDYMQRHIDFTSEIINDLESIIPLTTEGIICVENIIPHDGGRHLIERLWPWGLSDTAGKRHMFANLDVGVLITILMNLEKHPPQKKLF